MLKKFAVDYKVDIICLQETWLVLYEKFKLTEFNIIRQNIIEGSGGGTLIAIS